MKISLTQEGSRFEHAVIFSVTGMPRVTSAQHGKLITIVPDILSVEMCRATDREPWRIKLASAIGPMIVKSDGVGKRRWNFSYLGRELELEELPREYVAIAHKALHVAEAERNGGTPMCPRCGEPCLLADPTDPNQDGDAGYCEPCGSDFPLCRIKNGVFARD